VWRPAALLRDCAAAHERGSVTHVDDSEQIRLRDLGMRVRLRRVAGGLSQQRLGEAAGVSRVTVGSIERGDHPASVLAVWRIADALGAPVAELVAGPDNGDPPRT
jgi:DNA-binding XRE family transcriptional regulator